MEISRTTPSRVFAAIFLLLLLTGTVVRAAEPTLARLSFWVSPERIEEFESAYEERIVPILNEHGLVESPVRGRTTVDSVFSRLFAFASVAEMRAGEQALQKDSMWRTELQNIGATFGTAPSDSLLRASFRLYRTPAGPGRTVEVGPGLRKGAWLNLGVQDGLPSPTVPAMLQDRKGDLWFAIDGNGVCRYDGAEFQIFSEDDGLAQDYVRALLEDRQGNLWFATGVVYEGGGGGAREGV